MSSGPSSNRIALFRRRLAGFDHLCPGTLRRRSLVCGKENCRCKGDPPLLHGPYYYWSRREGGRLVQTVLSPAQARIVGKAIRNYRVAQSILREWGLETTKIVQNLRNPSR